MDTPREHRGKRMATRHLDRTPFPAYTIRHAQEKRDGRALGPLQASGEESDFSPTRQSGSSGKVIPPKIKATEGQIVERRLLGRCAGYIELHLIPVFAGQRYPTR